MVLFLGYLTFLGQALLALGIILFLFRNFNKSLKRLSVSISKNAIPLGLLIASSATLGSLILSEFLEFPPCSLCWYQRVFMYPQVIILGIAVVRSDSKIKIYSLFLSLIGLGIAIYHVFLQLFPAVLRCTEEVAKCSAVQLSTLGYITIPLMSATAFGLIALIMLFGLTSKKK